MGVELSIFTARLAEAATEAERLAILSELPPVLETLGDQAVARYADHLKPVAAAIVATQPAAMGAIAGGIGRPLCRAALNAKRINDVRDALDHLVGAHNDEDADAEFARFLALYGGAIGSSFANFPRSIEMLARSFQLAKRLGDIATQMRALNSVGVNCMAAGIYTEAIRYYEECASLIDIARHEPDHLRVGAIALGNLAAAYLAAGHPEEGLRALERRRSVILIEPANRISDLAVAIIECHLLVTARQTPRARAMFDQLLERWSELGEPALLKPPLAMAKAALLESGGDDDGAERTLVDAYFATDGMLGPRRRLLEQLLSLGAVRADECRYAGYIHMLRETELKAPHDLMAGALGGLRQNLSSMEMAEILDRDMGRPDVGESTGGFRSASLKRRNVAISTVEKCALLAELNEDPEGLHPFRVGALAALIAEAGGLNAYTVRSIREASRLHDFGKAAVPKYLLQKPGPLTPNEKRSVRKHSEDGMSLLADPQLPELQMAEEIAHYHHEWWNGTGYPAGLKGRQIPEASRIVAIADSYDSMTHHRPWRPAMTHDQAIKEMRALRGVQFDPDYFDSFDRIITKMHLLHGAGLEAILAEDAKGSSFHALRRQLSDQLSRSKLLKDGSAGSQ